MPHFKVNEYRLSSFIAINDYYENRTIKITDKPTFNFQLIAELTNKLPFQLRTLSAYSHDKGLKTHHGRNVSHLQT